MALMDQQVGDYFIVLVEWSEGDEENVGGFEIREVSSDGNYVNEHSDNVFRFVGFDQRAQALCEALECYARTLRFYMAVKGTPCQ
jgi:hypothetical protein